MKTNIIQIGNSKGIRLPKSILDQCCLKDAVEIEVVGNVLTIRAAPMPREKWSQAFAKMAECNDDKLLDRDTELTTVWDRREWRW